MGAGLGFVSVNMLKTDTLKKAILKTDNLKYVDYFNVDKRIISQTSIQK